jgi:hypothetical protein
LLSCAVALPGGTAIAVTNAGGTGRLADNHKEIGHVEEDRISVCKHRRRVVDQRLQ